jgi:hypothetical protein
MRTDAIRVQLKGYEGHNLIDVRVWFTGDDGKMRPGKGFCAGVRHLHRLQAAISKAVDEARARGLLAGNGEGGTE